MGRQFEAAVPGERGHEPGGQPRHVPRERVDDRPRRAPRHTDETDVTRAPLDQCRHVGLPGADEEIALPMPRDRAVLNRRGALANRDGPDDVAARLRRRGLRGRRIVRRWRHCACSAFLSTPRLCTNRLR